AMAEAAGIAVWTRLLTAVLSAPCRLVAVSAGVAPMLNWLAPGVALVVACKVMVWVEPSGRVNPNEIESPWLRVAALRSTEIEAGDPDGPVTAAPVNDELTVLSLRPNGELAASSLTETTDPVGAGMSRRPSPSAP